LTERGGRGAVREFCDLLLHQGFKNGVRTNASSR
jgi:3-deoxy-D-manno-octulosonate 8-phosphate phosphatase KdsC-like HAD superfamily phosphatase